MKRMINREDIVAILVAIENNRTIDEDVAERIYPILRDTVTGDELLVIEPEEVK